jgi:hypothetical protein
MFSAVSNGAVYAGSYMTGMASSLAVFNPLVNKMLTKIFNLIDSEKKIDDDKRNQVSAVIQRLTACSVACGLSTLSEYIMQTPESNVIPHALFSTAGLILASHTVVPATCYLTASAFQALGASPDLNQDFTTLLSKLASLQTQGKLSRESGLAEAQSFIDKHGLVAYRAMYVATVGASALGVLGVNELGGYMMATNPDFKKIMQL